MKYKNSHSLLISIDILRFDAARNKMVSNNRAKAGLKTYNSSSTKNDKQKAIEKNKAREAYNKAKDKYEMYKNNLETIKGWKQSVNTVLSDLTSAHSSFMSGGYVASGESFQEKDYNEMIKMLNEDIKSLDGLIPRVEARVEQLRLEMNKKLSYYNSL